MSSRVLHVEGISTFAARRTSTAGWLGLFLQHCSIPHRHAFLLNPLDRQFIAMKTHSILLIVCLLTAPRFSNGDDFTASESPDGQNLTPSDAPPDTLSHEPARNEGLSSTPAPSLSPPSMIERPPYYEDSPQSGFGTGPRPAGRTGRFVPPQMAPASEGFGIDGRDPRQRSEPSTGHDCSSHSPVGLHAPPSSLPYSGHTRYRAGPAGGSLCQEGACEFGYRGRSMNYRSRFQSPDESLQPPMSQFPRDGHDHTHCDGHSHRSHDQATASPDARQSRCPVDGATLGSHGRPAALLVDGQPVYLCSEVCMMQLLRHPATNRMNRPHDGAGAYTPDSEEPGEPHHH